MLLFSCRSGAAPFSPASLPGLTLWLRADLGITKDGSDLVSTWADQSGNGNDFTAAGGNRPTWTASTLNSQNGVIFGSGKLLAGPADPIISVNAANDVVLVFRLTTGPVGFPTILNLKTGAGANTTPNYYMNSGGGTHFAVGAGTGNFRTARAQFSASDNSYRYLKISFFGDGTQMTFDENGSVMPSGTPDTGSGADDNVLGALQLIGTSAANWSIQEVIIFGARNLTAPEWTDLKTYLAARYAL